MVAWENVCGHWETPAFLPPGSGELYLHMHEGHKAEVPSPESEQRSSQTSLRRLLDWVSQRLIGLAGMVSMDTRWFKKMEVMWACACVVVLWGWIEVRAVCEASLSGQMKQALTLVCCPISSQTVGSWAASHGCIISAPHVSLWSLGKAIDYRAPRHSIDDLLHYYPSPFLPSPNASRRSLFHISVPRVLLPITLLPSGRDYWKDLLWK